MPLLLLKAEIGQGNLLKEKLFAAGGQLAFKHILRLTQRAFHLCLWRGGCKRALAGNSEILILDDSSSALDYKTDSMLRQALRENYAGVTTIVIAQRVSSILHADHILVLDEGREIGYGTHEQLMESCQIYREISESQMGGDFG